MNIKRKLGPKGQIVIPKVIRESLGIDPGDEVVIEAREKEVAIKPSVNPETFVEDYCSLIERKLTKKVDLKKLLEEEVEERFDLR